MNHRKKIANRIKELRLEKKLSQTELAKKCGFTRQYISQYAESGNHNLTFDSLQKIAEALGCDIDLVEKSE